MRFSGLRSVSNSSTSQPLPGTAAGKYQNANQIHAVRQIDHPASVAERWASYVLAACKSERDPRTLAIWAHQVCVSYTTLSESCRLIDVQPRDARDFARILRIMLLPEFDHRKLASFLDISDVRTLDCILHKAGLIEFAAFSRQITISSFLDNQQFIAPENPGLVILRDIFAEISTS